MMRRAFSDCDGDPHRAWAPEVGVVIPPVLVLVLEIVLVLVVVLVLLRVLVREDATVPIFNR